MYTKIRPRYYESSPAYDPRQMEYMTYRNQISDPVGQTDPDIQYDHERKFLFVSSFNRDRAQYPDPAHFKVRFPGPYRDIVSIELAAGVLPNQGDIHQDGYVLLDIPELNHIQCVDGSSMFGILGLQYHPNSGFFNLDKSNTTAMPATFSPPKARLDSISITMRHPDGSQVLFGNEAVDTPADLALQTSLTFEIRTRVKRRQGMERDARASVPII